MKNLTLFLLATFGATISFSQEIKNKSFELFKGNKPVAWNINLVDGFAVVPDSIDKNTGIASIKITNETSTKSFQSFSQTVPITIAGIKKISVKAFIKTKDVAGYGTTWCQVWDDKCQIDFANLEVLGKSAKATSDWREYTMSFIVGPDVKKLLLGGLLFGKGTVWFDDFSVSEIPFPTEPASKTATDYIKEVKNIIKNNALFTDSLDWKKIDEELPLISRGMQTVDDTKPVIYYLLKQLQLAGDNHSFFTVKKVATDYKKGNFVADVPKSNVINNRIGYIYIPTFGTVNNKVGQSFSDTIKTLIKTIDEHHKIDGWIIDLRKNGGGNMWPMLAGLKTFVGKATPGYFVKGSHKSAWRIGGSPMILKNNIDKIAVLLGPSTASSGEMTAIAFIGKSNVKTFGQPSAGYTTANSIFYLSDGAMIALATSTVADRAQKTYFGKLIPDVMVEPVSNKDADIEAASNWILEK